MPSKSKSQQRFFGVVKGIQKGKSGEGKAKKAADDMSEKDVDDFASTKHKGLPNKVKRENRVKSLIKKMVREIMAEDFAGAYPKNKRKSFDNKRRKQSEVLGYTLTGKDDIKTEIDDATVKENIEEALPAIAMGLARGAGAAARAVGTAARAVGRGASAAVNSTNSSTDDTSEEYEELKERIKKILNNNPKLKESLMGALAAKTVGSGFQAGKKITNFKPEKDDEIEEIGPAVAAAARLVPALARGAAVAGRGAVKGAKVVGRGVAKLGKKAGKGSAKLGKKAGKMSADTARDIALAGIEAYSQRQKTKRKELEKEQVQEKTMKLTKSRLKNIVMEVIEEDSMDKKVQKNEQNLDKVKVPANINRFMGKFITAVQGGKLNRNRQKAILYKVVKGLGISPREFQMYVQKVKQGL